MVEKPQIGWKDNKSHWLSKAKTIGNISKLQFLLVWYCIDSFLFSQKQKVTDRDQGPPRNPNIPGRLCAYFLLR